MGDTIIDAPAPEGVVTRHDVELALRGRRSGSMRFMGWYLTEIDLNGLDLQGCEFMRCRAGHANFSSCNLTEARFLFCDFNNTKWCGTIVSSAHFQDCKMTYRLYGDLGELAHAAVVREMPPDQWAYLRGLSFRPAQLDGVDFQGADSPRCRLQGRAGADGLRPEGGECDKGAL